MPFRVHFSAPVIYQPGHPKAERPIVFLDVMAPTERGAIAHALRTTQGDAEITHVEEVEQAAPAPIHEVQDGLVVGSL